MGSTERNGLRALVVKTREIMMLETFMRLLFLPTAAAVLGAAILALSARAASRGTKTRSKVKRAKSIHHNTRAKSKQAAVVALLNRPQGATIAALWRRPAGSPIRVRGFLAGVVRKKLGLTLQSEKTEGERVYRVIEPQAA
jgi:hypothetical protein